MGFLSKLFGNSGGFQGGNPGGGLANRFPSVGGGNMPGMADFRAGGDENTQGKIAAAMQNQGYQFPQGPTANGGFAPDYSQAMQNQGMRGPMTTMGYGVQGGLNPLEMAQRYNNPGQGPQPGMWPSQLQQMQTQGMQGIEGVDSSQYPGALTQQGGPNPQSYVDKRFDQLQGNAMPDYSPHMQGTPVTRGGNPTTYGLPDSSQPGPSQGGFAQGFWPSQQGAGQDRSVMGNNDNPSTPFSSGSAARDSVYGDAGLPPFLSQGQDQGGNPFASVIKSGSIPSNPLSFMKNTSPSSALGGAAEVAGGGEKMGWLKSMMPGSGGTVSGATGGGIRGAVGGMPGWSIPAAGVAAFGVKHLMKRSKQKKHQKQQNSERDKIKAASANGQYLQGSPGSFGAPGSFKPY